MPDINTTAEARANSYSSLAEAKAAAERKLATTRLRVPSGMAPSINIGGVEVVADADGYVEVPTALADELRAHGLLG
ncbi:MAG TPA: hypothetical protein VGM81_13285 [Burkholderiaceae bacterium]